MRLAKVIEDLGACSNGMTVQIDRILGQRLGQEEEERDRRRWRLARPVTQSVWMRFSAHTAAVRLWPAFLARHVATTAITVLKFDLLRRSANRGWSVFATP
jgi:hypothetical protein